MSLDELKTYWPLISSTLGVLFGGAVTWATAKVKIDNLFKSQDALAIRVAELERAKENDRVALADRLARIEVTLNAVHIKIESRLNTNT
jgi:hypothetical protein